MTIVVHLTGHILGHAHTKHAREFKEAWHSMDNNTINRHVDIPTIYLQLKKKTNASTNNNTNTNTHTNLTNSHSNKSNDTITKEISRNIFSLLAFPAQYLCLREFRLGINDFQPKVKSGEARSGSVAAEGR